MARNEYNDLPMVKFCIDRFIDGKPYPNLAIWEAKPYTNEWKQFSRQWPFSEPVHFFEYLDRENIFYQLVSSEESDHNTFYPISLSFFDFDINWFEIIPDTIIKKLKDRSLHLWFFYSEGDDPVKIKNHLYKQAQDHDIDVKQIQFTSANSSASLIPGFHYFVDDECLFWLRNKDIPVEFHTRKRTRKFTALVRTGKWWRAAVMSQIWKNDWYKEGYFSYNNNIDVGEHWRECPIPLIKFLGLYDDVHRFLDQCPFLADELDSDTHNLYATTVVEHFENSYLNIILETHYDVDNTGGIFLTEKTFKPIKNCQPFVLFGAPGSIQQLRNMGYRTFDHVINHDYDFIQDNSKRWTVVLDEIKRLMSTDLHYVYTSCKDDLIWNQELFLGSKNSRVSTLINHLLTNANIS